MATIHFPAPKPMAVVSAGASAKSELCLSIANRSDSGQATTAYLANDLFLHDLPLLINSIDTYVNPRSLGIDQIRSGAEGWSPSFHASGEHWSFVRTGRDGWACEVAEKRRISDNASIGLYWFAEASTHINCYDKFFTKAENIVFGEKYIAPTYRIMINEDKKISYTDLPLKDVHV